MTSHFPRPDTGSINAYLQFGRIISCGDLAVQDELKQVLFEPHLWFKRMAQRLTYDSLDELEEEEGELYRVGMSMALRNYLVQFWHNAGDIVGWLVEVAANRGITLDRQQLANDIGRLEAQYDSNFAVAIAMSERSQKAVKAQHYELVELSLGMNASTIHGCVATSADRVELTKCNRKFKPAHLL